MRSPVCRLFLVLGMDALVALAQEERRATNLPISQTNSPLPSSQSPASASRWRGAIPSSRPIPYSPV
jgi:hypothetical protein